MKEYACEIRKTVVFDFDGVIHSYTSGWQGIDSISDPPVPGIAQVIKELREFGYEVVVHSTRCSSERGRDAIWRWLDKHDIVVDDISATKPSAICYIDDRAIRFDGNTKNLVRKITEFKSYLDIQEQLGNNYRR